MSLLSRLFGRRDDSGDAPAAAFPPEIYEGFTITPAPVADGGKWRVGAVIEKEVGGESKTHRMIRADTLESAEAAATASLAKARMLIDQQGVRLFD